MNAIRNRGKVVGIYTSFYEWGNVVGNSYSCTEFGNVPLWYAHYDNNPSFSDWRNFGGWTRANMKQYAGDTTLCGAGVDFSFY